MLFMIAWSMWHNRNAARHGSPRQFANLVVQKAWVLLDEFQTANHSISQPKENMQEFSVAPIAPSYKVNVDGTVFSQSCQAGVGIVIQDYEGEVIAALSKQIHQPLGPLEIEAKARRLGFHLLGMWA